jgi:small ligand-binding sensory domain FIST
MADVADGLATGTDLVKVAESAVGQALERLGGRRPDLLCVFVHGDDPNAIEGAATAAVKTADAGLAIGCSASGVIGAGRGVEQVDAVAAWAAVLPGVDLRPIHLRAHRVGDAVLLSGLPQPAGENAVGVLLADPYAFPIAPFVAHCNDTQPGLPLVGGLASGPLGPGSAKLLLNEVMVEGAVGVLLSGPITARIAVSQGCRPIGPPMTVTKADANMLLELAGLPAYRKLQEVVAELPPEERAFAVRGLHLGVAMNEYAETHERGDFLIRAMLGADERTGALVVGDTVDVGTTVRFQVRDAAAADEDLSELLRGLGDAGESKGALLFSCNGRGKAMFPNADHDVVAVRQSLGLDAVAGFFAAGELGPIAGRNHVHGFTASILTVGSPHGVD